MKNIIKPSGLIVLIILILLIHSCKKEEKTKVPTLTTFEVTDITFTTASCNVNITNDGNSPITVRGVCWSESQNPRILDEKTIDGNGVGEFTSDIIGLLPNTTYYIRSYATNNVGTAYGNQVTLKTNELNLAILDVSKDKEWSYWVIAKDGSNYFVKLNANNRPISAYFKPDINNKGYSIFFDEKGLPSKMVVENFVFIFSNYRDQLVDVALISPNGDINIQRDLKVSIDLDFFNKKSFVTDLAFGLNITSKAIGIASCIGSLVTVTGVGAVIGIPLLVGCASTIVGIAATIFPDEVGAIGDNFKAVGLFAGVAGCALGDMTACVSVAEKAAIEYEIIALNSMENANVSNAILELKLPTITTNTVTSVFSSSAVSGGNISSTGGASIIARGICWSTSANPTTALSTKTSDGTGIGAFTSSITGLTANTTYYVRAYATNSVGTTYGSQISFVTASITPVVPTLSTAATTSITRTTATSGGNITSNGGATVTASGVCWSTTTNPTISLSTKTTDGSATGAFTSSITGLTVNTTYYVKAYAINSRGTAYGSELTFTTSAAAPVIPTLTTVAATSITQTTASSGGNITSNGGATVTASGVCWSTTTNPTISLSTKTTDGSVTGSFTSSITGLTTSTTYYVKAYATNSVGTAYGNELTFTTSAVASTVPGAPTIGTASAGNGQATVTFTAPGSNGGSAITGYTVISSPGNITGSGSANPITVSGLTNGTAYTFTVTATNAIGTSSASSASNSVTPSATLTIVSDIDGNVYNTVTIGTQTWMAENLKTTKYNDGNAIPNVTDNTAWAALTTPSYCWYNNDATTYKATYGALYNWYAVNSTSNGGKNVCPTGWHVPSDAEWTTLTDYLGEESVGGGKLKETGTTHWTSPNTGATNETGFTALPGGYRYFNGTFDYIGSGGFWWSSTATGTYYAWHRTLRYNESHVGGGDYGKMYGFSVRCVRDN
jgi:uncharacterized protein (TIGR02145 family)